VGGYEPATGARTRWHLQRNEWSVHFNTSPDGLLFCGDGGGEGMVAHAPDGKWLYLFTPELIPDSTGTNIAHANFITPGVFRSEKLVNMGKHDYALEPNATFTPDMKWIVFRSNMHGAAYVYAVELRKAGEPESKTATELNAPLPVKATP
jgi:oligogalacturonide lyase